MTQLISKRFLISLILLSYVLATVSEAHSSKADVLAPAAMPTTIPVTMPVKTSTDMPVKMADQVLVIDAWARATFALAKTGAAYMTLQNTGDANVQLMSVDVDESVASVSELHHTKMADGMMQMQELEEGVVILKGETIAFAPGGKHIMLMGLTGPLDADKKITLTLVFSDGSSAAHSFPIKDARKVKM